MKTQEFILKLDDSILSRISGGDEVISSSNKVSNIINYYLNLIPFVSKNHVRITYNAEDWQGKDTDKTRSRNIKQKVEFNEMKWKELSGLEKTGVICPVAGAAFLGTSLAGCTLFRVIKTRLEAKSLAAK